MNEIVHFCLFQSVRDIDINIKKMKCIQIQKGINSSIKLFIQQKQDNNSTEENIGTFIIGNPHNNNDGIYLKIIVNESCITFVTDVISGIPVFIYKNDKGIIITSLLSVLIDACNKLGLDIELDLEACSEVMLSSYIFTRGKTLLKNVSRILPNHELKLDLQTGSLESRRVAEDWNYNEQQESWTACINSMRQGLLEGMERYRGKRVAVMLSGGADSRITAAAATEAGLEPDFFTFGQSTVNASDFSIAAAIAHKLNRPLKTYNATSMNFRINWQEIARKSNWSDMWNLSRLPMEFFEELGDYDIVFRGDGDGIYGWKGVAGNVSDVLHQLEISPMAAALKNASIFLEPSDVFSAGEEARNKIINEYKDNYHSTIDLKNILYQKHREYGCIAQNLWVMANWMKCDTPLLWKSSMDAAARVPPKHRKNKHLIFHVLNTFMDMKSIPFSAGGSWNDQLDNWMVGLTGELIEYVYEWSPWPVNRDKLDLLWNLPPMIPSEPSVKGAIFNRFKSIPNRLTLIRRYVLNNHPNWVHSTFCDRGLTRLTVLSNLNQVLKESKSSV